MSEPEVDEVQIDEAKERVRAAVLEYGYGSKRDFAINLLEAVASDPNQTTMQLVRDFVLVQDEICDHCMAGPPNCQCWNDE